MPVPSQRVPIDSITPDFTLAAVAGDNISLSDYRGRCCLVLVFLRGFL
ncbi:MAG: hypothetical protein QF369_01050 [Dehalococcoidales bacterium]|nr:hypothetical protein [Dehalococcoidales bacterium]MDP6501076.1 hypothetical protein [Dehalococcoidales bacterium]